MHGNVAALNHLDEFGQVSRYRCRNPHCRMKLKAPVANPHKAFCTPGCYSSFYLKRCVVCEKEKPAGSTARRMLCPRPKCRSRYHQNGGIYSFLALVDTVRAPNAVRNIDKTGTFSRDVNDRPWRIVAAGSAVSANVYYCASLPIDPDTARRTAAANDWSRIRQEISWSKRARSPRDSKIETTHPVVVDNPYLHQIPDGLSIPQFLRRVPS
jgi:hypothetical protein